MASDSPVQLPCQILGYGTALPQRIVASTEVDELCGLESGWIEQHTGVKFRHWATTEDAISLGTLAAHQALTKANMKPSDIDLIINASGTPHQAIPDGGPLFQRALGLGNSGILSFSVHATCLSFLLGLETASRWIATGGARHVLIITSEIGSRGLNFTEPESAGLIGDGATALILGPATQDRSSGIISSSWQTHGDTADLTEIRGCGTASHPSSAHSQAVDHLFHMDGKPLLKFVLRKLPGFLSSLQLPVHEHDWLVPHQASKAGLALLSALKWPANKTLHSLANFGNCIAASIPLTFMQGLESGQIQHGQRILLAGTGAGISFGALSFLY